MHIMIDLETMGTRPAAPIVSIGAVKFDKEGLHGDFYTNVDLTDALKHGGVVDGDTFMWWMSQSDEARWALLGPTKYVCEALVALFDFLGAGGAHIEGVWGNSSTFDNVILRETATRAGIDLPWPFYKDKCYRTVSRMYPGIMLDRSGTHHNALDDARTQAKHLIEMDKASGGIIL